MSRARLWGSLFFSVVFFSGCGNIAALVSPAPHAVPPSVPAMNEFRDTTNGVQITYSASFAEKPITIHERTSTTTGASVFDFSYPDGQSGIIFSGQTLEVFAKPSAQSIEKAITGLLVHLGKKPQDCRVITTTIESAEDDVVASTTVAYTLELAKPALFSSQEKAAILDRQKNYSVDRNGFMDVDYLKRQFANDHLVEHCSSYAHNPVGLTGSKSIRGVFYYNPSQSVTHFVFAAPLYDPRLYQNIQLLP